MRVTEETTVDELRVILLDQIEKLNKHRNLLICSNNVNPSPATILHCTKISELIVEMEKTLETLNEK